MKKIMFNDKYGLTEAVLEGKKTMTRRIIRNRSDFDPRQDWMVSGVDDKGKANIAIFHIETYKYSIYPQYQVGEVVAVAQSYSTILNELEEPHNFTCMEHWESTSAKRAHYAEFLQMEDCPGCTNKMFVRADLMPHQIQITDIKMERLQDISGEDCLKEGIICNFKDDNTQGWHWNPDALPFDETFCSPREAFADLIDKVSGKGTWERNPWVFAYEFKLVK